MKTKGKKKDKVNIVTLGCSKNLVDSEVMLTQLRGNNIDATHEATKDNANIVIVNTCGFIDNAKQESIDTIIEGRAPETRTAHIRTSTVTARPRGPASN